MKQVITIALVVGVGLAASGVGRGAADTATPRGKPPFAVMEGRMAAAVAGEEVALPEKRGQATGWEGAPSVAVPVSAFLSLTPVNHVAAVAMRGALRFAGMREATPGGRIESAAVLRAGAGADFVRWHPEPVAVVSSSAVEWARPQRVYWRQARQGFWPHQRPLRGAQVWLRRKQP
jgi:hypothetical protein